MAQRDSACWPLARTGASHAHGVLAIKFGGTSLATTARVKLAARRVRSLLRRGWLPVVIVSAAGSTTDQLLRRVQRILGTRHAHDSDVAAKHVSPAIDRLLATGEDRSAALLAAALAGIGVPATSVRAHEGILRAEGPHGAARLTALEPGEISTALLTGVVPVVTGFQGVRSDGALVTLGRGSSDTTAVFIAAELGAHECHIVTDVDGVYDRDPRLTSSARRLDHLSPDALVALCEGGAEVIHSDAARGARAAGMTLRVYHYQAPLGRRTETRIAPEIAAC